MKSWLRFPPPLHILVPLVALVCSMVYLGFKLLLVTEWKVENLVDTQISSVRFHAQRLALIMGANDAVREKLLKNQLSTMRTYPALRWALVVDARGIVVHSTQASWVGKPLSGVAPRIAVDLAEKTAAERVPQDFINGRDSVMAAWPAPEAAESPLQFIALAERDITGAISIRLRENRTEIIVSTSIAVLSSMLLGVVLFVFLKWRMRSFYRTTGLDNGGGSSPLPLRGGDEFAEISTVLSRAEHLLRDIAENLEEVVWIVTPDLRPAYLSPAFERIYLRSRCEASVSSGGMPDYILQEYHQPLREAFLAVVKGAPSLQLEYRVRRGDGQIRWIEARGFPVRDAAGTLRRIVGLSRDITLQKNLQEELVNVSEKERHSLGHDLHDDACQRLAGIKLKSDTLATWLRQEGSPHAAFATELTAQIAGTTTLLRNIARGLAPVEVEGDGLMHALQKLVQLQETIHEVPCFFDPEQTVIVTNGIVATHLYRIAQEFITNAARHAKPERIDVRLEELPSHIRLTVVNDGLPFQKPAADHHGMGLKIIRYRASAIGATIDIRLRTDGIQGTIAECTVPHDICHAATDSAGTGTASSGTAPPA